MGPGVEPVAGDRLAQLDELVLHVDQDLAGRAPRALGARRQADLSVGAVAGEQLMEPALGDAGGRRPPPAPCALPPALPGPRSPSDQCDTLLSSVHDVSRIPPGCPGIRHPLQRATAPHPLGRPSTPSSSDGIFPPMEWRSLTATRFGFCDVCGRPSAMVATTRNKKEAMRCIWCRASARNRLMARTVCRIYQVGSIGALVKGSALNFHELDVYEAQAAGPIHKRLKRLPRYVCSEYWDDIEPGDFRDGVRCENLEMLTFSDGSFDLIIHQSVLEHVENPDAALAECARVLRQDGRLVFEVPVCDYEVPAMRPQSRRRLPDEPLFHIDPLRREGVLVVTDFGLDVVDQLECLGFRVDLITEHYGDSVITYCAVFSCRLASEH
jgi:SAM-dependent methyltransferase